MSSRNLNPLEMSLSNISFSPVVKGGDSGSESSGVVIRLKGNHKVDLVDGDSKIELNGPFSNNPFPLSLFYHDVSLLLGSNPKINNDHISPDDLERILKIGLTYYGDLSSRLGSRPDSIAEKYGEQLEAYTRLAHGYASSKCSIGDLIITQVSGPVPDSETPRVRAELFLLNNKVKGPAKELIKKLKEATFFDTRIVDIDESNEFAIKKSRCCFWIIDPKNILILVDGSVGCIGKESFDLYLKSKNQSCKEAEQITAPEILHSILRKQVLSYEETLNLLVESERRLLLRPVPLKGDNDVSASFKSLRDSYEYIERKIHRLQRVIEDSEKLLSSTNDNYNGSELIDACLEIAKKAEARKNSTKEESDNLRANVLEGHQVIEAIMSEKIAIVMATLAEPSIAGLLLEFTKISKHGAHAISVLVVAAAIAKLYWDKRKISNQTII